MKSSTPALLIGTTVVYAASYPLGALALHTMSPFLLITLRFLVAAPIMWTAVALLRSALPRGRAWWHAIGAGTLVQGVHVIGAYWAMSHGVSSGIAALVVAMNPVVVTILGGLLDRRREPWRAYLAVGIGVVAVVLACAPRIARDPAVGPGLVALVVALLGLSTGSVWQGRTLRGVSPVSFTAIGVTASLPIAAVLTLTSTNHVAPGGSTWLWFGVVTVATLVGTTLYAATVARRGARGAAILFAVIPAVAALCAWALLGEPLDALVVVALILGGAACVIDVRASAMSAAPQSDDSARSATMVACSRTPGSAREPVVSTRKPAAAKRRPSSSIGQ